MASEEQGNKIKEDLIEQMLNLPEGFTYVRLSSEPNTVPLTIYLDERKYIVGTATVIGRKVHAQINPKDGRELEELVKAGIIESMSVHFSTGPPAQPQLPLGEIRSEDMNNFWMDAQVTDAATIPSDDPEFSKHVTRRPATPVEYNFEPTDPIRHISKMEGLAYGHTIEDEEIDSINETAFKDKFPYGPA